METFEEIIKGELPVLIDFYATWCGPCKAVEPVIDALANEFKGKIRVLRIDVDKNQAAAAQLHIQAVPTLMIIKKGKIVWRNAGVMDKTALAGHLKNFI